MSIVRRVGEVSSTVLWALPGKVQSHAMLVIVEACKPGEGGIESVEKEGPKGLSAKCHELTSRVS